MSRPKKTDNKEKIENNNIDSIINKELESKNSIADTLNKERLEQYKTKEKYYIELIDILSRFYGDEINKVIKTKDPDLNEIKEKINAFIESNNKKIEINQKIQQQISPEPSKKIFNGSIKYN